MTSSRDKILRSLRQSSPYAVLPQISELKPGSEKEDVDQFIQRAIENVAQVFRVSDTNEMSQLLVDYFTEKSAKSWLVVEDDRLDLRKFREITSELQADYVGAMDLDRDAFKDAAFSCDVGVTFCDLGVAESGSVVIFHRLEAPRLASIAPRIHVAVLQADSIIRNMGQLAARIRGFGEELPSACTVISGVSRTADINLTVTLGMHGPLELVIIVIDPPGN